MPFRKFLRALLISILVVAGAFVLLAVFSIGPVDRTPVAEHTFYGRMQQRLDTLVVDTKKPTAKLSVGYAVVNLTPPMLTSTAGYGNRRGKLYTGVRDSLFVRTMVIGNGVERVAIVSADLLIIPPKVSEALGEELKGTGFNLDNTYLSATHTHNSIGNWGEGAARFIYGRYDERVVEFIVEQIVQSVRLASENVRKADIKVGLISVPDAVNNRLVSGGPEDPGLRVMEVHRDDSTKLLLMSFAAHSTCLFSKDLELSRDYPGELVDRMEANGYTFAMFLAGAMASHGFGASMAGDECIDWMANEISTEFLANLDALEPMYDSTIAMVRVPLLLSDPQVKISENLKVRSWLFRSAFGEYPAFLTGLRIGSIVFLGTPCDFSGAFNPAIDSLASRRGLFPIVTSFNGGYIGYLTPRAYYDYDHYETRFMNWYAPGTGEYVTESLEQIMKVLDQKP